MNKLKVFNGDAMVSVEFTPLRKAYRYEYLPAKKGFFNKQEEGFYSGWYGYLRMDEVDGAGYINKGNVLYFKPCVTLVFVKGTVERVFDTNKEAKKYYEEMRIKYIDNPYFVKN
jgi:hypothetical protein